MEMRTHQYCSNGNRGKCSHGRRQTSFYNDLLPRSLPAINTSTDFCNTQRKALSLSHYHLSHTYSQLLEITHKKNNLKIDGQDYIISYKGYLPQMKFQWGQREKNLADLERTLLPKQTEDNSTVQSLEIWDPAGMDRKISSSHCNIATLEKSLLETGNHAGTVAISVPPSCRSQSGLPLACRCIKRDTRIICKSGLLGNTSPIQRSL